MGSLDTAAEASIDPGRQARLLAIEVADDPASWEQAGFAVADGRLRVGATDIVLVGARSGHQGIVGWTLAGLPPPDADDQAPAQGVRRAGTATLDGLPTTFADSDAQPQLIAPQPSDPGPRKPKQKQKPTEPTLGGEGPDRPHRNGIVGLDHVVVSTPDLARTTAALAAIGVACRRVRETTAGGRPMRQAFFRLGPTVLEVISGATDSGETAEDAPAAWFGLAFDTVDLDATAAVLGDGLGPIRHAVQEGRRIATLRHRSLGLSVAVAVMDDHAGR